MFTMTKLSLETEVLYRIRKPEERLAVPVDKYHFTLRTPTAFRFRKVEWFARALRRL